MPILLKYEKNNEIQRTFKCLDLVGLKYNPSYKTFYSVTGKRAKRYSKSGL